MKMLQAVLRMQTLLIRIRILLVTLVVIRIWLFDPYCFKKVMYLKQYFLYILTWFSLSVGPTGPNRKAYLVDFSLPVNVVRIRVAYGSGSWKMIRIRIHNTGYKATKKLIANKPCCERMTKLPENNGWNEKKCWQKSKVSVPTFIRRIIHLSLNDL
jgi:hypothetical protein